MTNENHQPRSRHALARWESELMAKCDRFVREIAPGLEPPVHAHVVNKVFVAMHRTLRHVVVLPGSHA